MFYLERVLRFDLRQTVSVIWVAFSKQNKKSEEAIGDAEKRLSAGEGSA